MKRLLPLILFFATIGLWADDFETILNQYAEAVARVEISNASGVLQGSGSGFAVNDGRLVITNAHVVSDAYYDEDLNIILRFLEGDNPNSAVLARIVSFDAEMDLCSLSIEDPRPVAIPVSDTDIPPLMSEIMVLGYPLGLSFKSTTGRVQAHQEIQRMGTMVDLTVAVDPGNSGGPVLDSSGEVVGVVTAHLRGFNFNLALPSRSIRLFLAGDDGRVDFTIDPDLDGTRVFINGHFRGVTPLTLSVPAMPLSLKLQINGYEDFNETVDPTQDTDYRPELIASAPTIPMVTITTEPPGAPIVINNRIVGDSPTQFEAEPGKRLRIRIELRGYRDFYQEFTVSEDSEQTIEINLEKKGLFR